MELKRVEISGFKSFPERIEVAFDKGITAIVGPNGSGKSNIADAVRWVLGEQSARTLRGAKMEDVIFAGTARRKPLGFAEVTLVLDNKDRKASLDYDEIAIRRRLFRSGESEYAINGAKCRLKDIQEILMDTGIGKDGYSMIGQGQIDRLLSSKPQDRRMIFEEAAGITKYRTRREEAEKKLEDQQQQLVRVEDILQELRSREEVLREQAETAEKYLALKEELKLYEVSAFIGEYDQLKAQYDKVQAQMDLVVSQIEDAKKKQLQAKEKSDRLSKASGEARNVLSEMKDHLRELMLENEKAEGDRRVQESRKAHHSEEIRQLEIRMADLNSRIADREETLRKEENKMLEYQQELDEKTDSLLDLQRDMRLLSEEIDAKQRELKNSEKISLQMDQNMVQLQMEAQRQELMNEQTIRNAQNYESEKDALTEETEKAERLIRDTQQQEIQIREKLNTEQEKRSEIQKQLSETEETIRECKEKQENSLLQMKDLTRKLQWLKSLEDEYEGFSGPVKAVMKLKEKYGNRIRGTVSDLVHIDRKYMTAMQNVLGAQIQNIVVSDTQTAKSLVEHLRRTESGRATFLPLDAVFGRGSVREAEEVSRMVGVIGFANDLVQADPEYRKILDRLLGNVVVADSFDHGSSVSRKYGQFLRVVTLDGDLFNIGGSITGGSNKQKGPNLLERRSESESVKEELNSLRSGADQIQKKLTAANQEKFALLRQIDACDREIQSDSRMISEMDQQVKQAEFVSSQAKERLTMLENSFLLQNETLEKQETERKKSGEKIAALQKEVDTQKETGRRLEKELADFQNRMNELKEEEGRRTIAIAGIRQQKSFMLQSGEWEKKEIATLREEKENTDSQRESLRNETLQAEREIGSINALIAGLQSQIAEEQTQIGEQAKIADTADTEREQSIREGEEYLQAYAALEKEQVRMESQLQRAGKEIEDLQERMWNDYEMTYGTAKDLADGGFEHDEKMKEAASLSKTKRHQNILRVRGEIRNLGNVNVGAVEEYKALTERLTFLTTQHDDIVKSSEDLKEIIERMNERMEKQFSEGFAKVAESFNTVFAKMFGGGQGILKLTEGAEELEAGIEITVQPPGKKLQSMMLLSGGEKALTAICLLFAIQQLNPAPFCILDEIEAALDDVNVDRYAQFLQEMKNDTQFIIITHRKGTMNAADTMYGVTMEEKGVSKCVSVRFA